MTRYLLANLLGLLLLVSGGIGLLAAAGALLGIPGPLLLASAGALYVGRDLATLSPPASPPYAGGYTYERDAR